ncbi:MAG TPA: hypothetical protein VF804_06185 [Holophagaceae bacterium]
MVLDAWILGAPLKVQRREDHPYQETDLATLGRHELVLSRVRSPLGEPGCQIFLDGHGIYAPGDPAPGRPWFDLCRELGYEPSRHWDWDPSLILFQQVVPALAAGWHEPPIPLDEQGVPEGVVCLATLRQAFAAAVAGLRQRNGGPVADKVAETFEWLPLRAVVFHDEAQPPLDFDGLGGPCGRISLWLGIHRDRAVVLGGEARSDRRGRHWLPGIPGGDLPVGPETFLAAAGLDPIPPKGFEMAFRHALEHLCGDLEDLLDAYRRTYPVGIPWQHDAWDRLRGRTIVDVRAGQPSVLVLDDGTELTLEGAPQVSREPGGI